MPRSISLSIHIAFLFFSVFGASVASGAVTGTVIDSGGQPIEGAEVRALESESQFERSLRWLKTDPSPTVLAEATTDSKGEYKLDVDRAITALEIEISAPGHFPTRFMAPHDSWIGAAVLPAVKNVEGRVVSGDDPVAGALVILRGSSGAEIRRETDDAGRFTIPDPSNRAETIVVIHPDHAPFLKRWRSSESMTIRLERGTPLSGRVVGPDGETATEGAVVTIDDWPLATSADDGSFAIAHAPKNWSQARVSKGSLVNALRRTTARSTTVRLEKKSTLSGTVVEAGSGRGIPHVQITLGREGRFSEPLDQTVTDGSGRFTFQGVLPGSYALSTSHPSWAGEGVEVTVFGNDSIERRIQLRRAATVRGRASDERGEPVAAASITSSEDSPSPNFRRMLLGVTGRSAARTAPDGRFVLFGIEPEKAVRLNAAHSRFPSVRTDRLELEPGEVKSTTILFPRGVSLSGVVTNTSGDPISGARLRANRTERGRLGAQVMIRAMQGSDEPALTDARGRFDLKVEEGSWDLTADADGFAAARLNAIQVDDSIEPIEVVLEEGVAVQGRVVRSGVGIADVMINVLSRDRIREPINTGPDGSFLVEDLPRGSVTLIAVKPDELIQEMRSVTAPDPGLMIEIPPGGTVRGHVLDATTNEPVPDFQAGPSPERRIRMPGSLQSFHSEEGVFVIENVPPGRHELIVQAPGYLEETLRGIEIKEGEVVDDIQVELKRGIRVTGTVRDSDGRPISGVSVSLESDEQNPLAQIMPAFLSDSTTDSSGRYTIPSAPPGETTIVFAHENYVATRKSVDFKGEELTVDAILSSGRTVSGVVVTEAGAPVSGAMVRVSSAAQSSRRNAAETDATGRFTLDGLADGRYGFVATHQRYANAEQRDVDITSGQPVRLVMTEGGTIVGRVLGVEPKLYAEISVLASGGGTMTTSSVSPDGTFRLDAIKPGNASVSARMTQMFNNRTTDAVLVEVVAGSQSNVDLVFETGSRVSGRVTKFGEPLRNGVVRFNPRDRSSRWSSSNLDAEGRYSVEGVDPGTYEVTVFDLESNAPFSRVVEVVSEPQTVDIDIRGGQISGRVIDSASSQPIENARVTLERSDAEQSSRFSRLGATTGSSGEFSIHPVAEGNYLLRVERTGFGHATRDLFIAEGREESVELSLQPNDGIPIRVVDRRDGRPLRADVAVHDARNALVWEGSPSPREDGGIRIPVAPGSYRVIVFASGYAPSTVQLSSPGASETIALSIGGALVIDSRGSDRMRARLLDASGAPARISRWNRSGEIWVGPGPNRIENLSAGQYSVQILGDGGATLRSEPVTVRDGETTTISI